MRFSASRINAWMNCPLSAHYNYTLKLPRSQSAAATFGTCIHAALEHFNTHADDYHGAVQIFLDMWERPEQYGIDPDWWPNGTSFMSYRKLGIAILEDFKESLTWDGRTVIGTEIPFLVPFGEHELTGFIDLLEVRKSGKGKPLLRVVDYKTAGTQPTKAKLALDVQFTTYLYAVSCEEFWLGNPNDPDFPGLPDGQRLLDEYGELSTRAIWYHLRKQKEIDAGARGDADFLRLYRVCHEIAKAIEADIHVPKIGDPCNLCDFTEQCALEIPVEFGVKADEDPDAWV